MDYMNEVGFVLDWPKEAIDLFSELDDLMDELCYEDHLSQFTRNDVIDKCGKCSEQAFEILKRMFISEGEIDRMGIWIERTGKTAFIGHDESAHINAMNVAFLGVIKAFPDLNLSVEYPWAGTSDKAESRVNGGGLCRVDKDGIQHLSTYELDGKMARIKELFDDAYDLLTQAKQEGRINGIDVELARKLLKTFNKPEERNG